MPDIQIDPEFHQLIAPLTGAETVELEASLKTEGCRDALTCWDGLLLDGHNRLEICKRLGIPFETKTINLADRESAAEWIITNQLARRNITLYQRTRLVLRRDEIIKARAKKRQIRKPESVLQNSGEQKEVGTTDDKLATMAGTSHDTIYKTRKLENDASEEVKNNLMQGKTTINREYHKLQKDAKKRITKPKAERIESIRALAARGFRADQIAAEIGIGAVGVRRIARDGKIWLPDAVVGNRRKLDVNRIVSQTVMGAQSLVSGLELVDSRLDELDMDHIEEWINGLGVAVSAINRLINQLRRRKNHGK